MSKKAKHNKFFLISFLPAIAYWYLEVNYSLQVALIGGLGLAVLELLFEYFFLRHIHLISKINFFLILFLASMSFLGEEGIWFKLQPMFTGLFLGGFLLYRNLTKRSVMWEMVNELNDIPPPQFIIVMMEKHMSMLSSN